ncbi:MAG: T9SS type A sorting domain-containing protein [Bacteroidetes bacterium]|nr:T9SS type A sorting domain-containing protein [Bacteroidota bacterium]
MSAQHPDAGSTIKPQGCLTCVEQPHLRKENVRYYFIPEDPGALVIEQSDGPLHYRDAEGYWRISDPAPRLLTGRLYAAERQLLPAYADLYTGASWVNLPGGQEVRWNQQVQVWQIGRNPQHIGQLAFASGPVQEGLQRLVSPSVLPGMDRWLDFEKGSLKTSYLLHTRPDVDADSWMLWEEEVSLPAGWSLQQGRGRMAANDIWCGEVVALDVQGETAVRFHEPALSDAREAAALTDAERQALVAEFRSAGVPDLHYGYRIRQENGRWYLGLAVHTNLLRANATRYPVLIDPQVSVSAANPATYGSQSFTTCLGPDLNIVVPGGYRVENVRVAGTSRATGACGLCIFSICIPSGSSFPCWVGNTGYQFVGPCGSAAGACGGTGPGTCGITSDLNDPQGVPWLADCVTPQCTDYTVTFNAGIRNFSDCGGGNCADAGCFFSNPGDASVTIFARNLELVIAPSVGTLPTVEICQGESVSLTATATWGVAPYTYSWSPTTDLTCAPTCDGASVTSNGVNIGSNTYTVLVEDACGTTRTADVTVATNPTVTGNSISTANPSTICQHSTVDLTGSTPIGGTGTYTYQWERSDNGGPFTVVGGGIDYSSDAISVTGTVEFRRVAMSGNCTPSYSNTIGFTVTAADLIANNTISSPVSQLCAGSDPDILTGTTPPTLSGGDGTNYLYQWQYRVNAGAFEDIPGAESADYDPPVLGVVGGNNTTYTFRRQVTSGTCQQVSSNEVTLTVYVGFANNTITAPAATTVCLNGDPANIAGSVPTVGQGALTPITYQWQQNVNGGGWADIPGAQSQAYDPPALTTAGTWLFRRLASAGPCTNHISNEVTITVLSPVAGNTITPPFATSLCASADFTVILGSTPTGGTGAYTYQWQQSINGAAFTNVATTINYDPPALNPAVLTTYQYRRIVSSGACTGVTSSISDTVTLTVTPAIGTNTLTAPAVINFCQEGDPDLIVGSTPTGGEGSYTYQWEMSVNSTTVYTAIPGAVARDYDAPLLSLVGGVTTTYRFRRIVSSGLCNSTSTIVTITIQPGVTNNITANTYTYCAAGDPPNQAAAAATNGGGAPYFYQWQQRIDGGAWTDVATTQAYDPPALSNATTGTVVYEFRRVAWSALCPTPVISPQVVTVNLLPQVVNSITAPASTTICGNPDPIVGNDPTGGTGAYTYQWQYQRTAGAPTVLTWTSVSATVPPTGNTGATARDFDLGNITIAGTYLFRRLVTSGVCANNASNEVTLEITAPLVNNAITQPAVAAADFCSGGDPATIPNTGVLSGGNGAYTYQWQVDTNNVDIWQDIPGANAQTYDPPVLDLVAGAQTLYRFRRLTSSGHCSDIATNIVTYTVRTPVAGNTLVPAGVTDICGTGGTGVINGSIPTGGTGVYSYQWQVSTDGVTFTNFAQTGQNMTNVAAPALPGSGTVTRWYRRMVRSNATGVPCDFTPSDTVIFTWNPVLSANTITAPATVEICESGDALNIAGNVQTGGSGVYTYIWQVDTNSTNVWYDIPGAMAASYDPPVLNLVNNVQTTYRYRRITSSGNCENTSNIISFTVRIPVDNNLVTTADLNICGAVATGVISGSVPTGGTGVYGYQWQVSTDGGLSYTNVVGATAQNLPSQAAPAIPAATEVVRYYRRGVRSNATGVPCDYVYSAPIRVSWTPAMAGTNTITAPAAADYCQQVDPALITSATVPTGGMGVNLYQWQVQVNGGTWVDIPGAIGTTYDPDLLVASLDSDSLFAFRRVVRSGNCTFGTIATTGVYRVRRPIQDNVITAPATTTYCAPGDVDLIEGLVPVGGNGAPAYLWQWSTDGGTIWNSVAANSPVTNPTNGNAGFTAQNLDLGRINVAGNYLFRRRVSLGACVNDFSNEVAITISGTIPDNTITAPAVVDFCDSGDPAAITGSAPAIVDPFTYIWEYRTGTGSPLSGAWTLISGANGQDYDPDVIAAAGATQYHEFRRGVVTACGTQYSTPVLFFTRQTINPGTLNNLAQLTYCVTANIPAYTSSAATLGQRTPVPGGENYIYQWEYSTNNGVSWNDVAATAPATSVNHVNFAAQNLDLGVLTTPGTYLFRRRVTRGPCGPEYTNTVTLNIGADNVGNNIITAPAVTNVCGNPEVITGSDPTGGDGVNYTYQWQWQRVTAPTTTWANVTATAPPTGNTGFAARDLDLGTITTAGTYEFRRIVTSGCSHTSNVISLNITLVLNPGAVTFTALTGCGSANPAVSGSTAASGGTGAITYSWEYSTDGGTTWDSVTATVPATTANVTAATIDLGDISTPGTYRFRRIAYAGNCVAATAMAANAITVLPVIADNTITAPAVVDFCPTPSNPNPDVIIGSVPSGGTGAYTYQWQYQRTVGAPTVLTWTNVTATVPPSGNTGFTAQDLDLGTLTIPGTYLFRRLVTSGACTNAPSDNEVALTITLPLTNNTLAAPAAVDFCQSGDPAVINNSGVLGGGTGSYTYQWQVDTNNVDVWHDIPLATGQTYDPPLLTLVGGAQTLYRFRRLTSSQHCVDLATAPVSITVRAPVENNILTTTGQDFCGTTATGAVNAAVPTGGTGVYGYQWQVSTDGVTFTNIAQTAQNMASQAAPALPGTGTITRWYRRLVRSNATGVPCDFVPSDTIVFTWNPVFATNTVPNTNTTICSGAQPAIINASTPTGGNGTYTYRWQVDTNGVNVWHDIPGSNVEDYQPGVLVYVGAGATASYRFRRYVSSGNCGDALAGNITTFTVQPALANNTVTPPSALEFCATGQPESILGTVPTGGTGGPTYTWLQRFNGGAWAAATGTNNGQNYTPPLLTVPGTYEYTRRVTLGATCAADTSNIVTIVLQAGTPISGNTLQTPAVREFCISGDPAVITASAVLAGGGGGYTYQWQNNVNAGGWMNIPSATGDTYDPPVLTVLGSHLYRRVVTAACGSSISPAVTIIIQPELVNNTITPPAVTGFCGTGDPELFAGTTPMGGEGVYVYDWEVNIDGGGWSSLGVSTQSYDPPLLTAAGVYEYRRTVVSGACNTPVISNTVTITIGAPVPGTVFTWTGGVGDWDDPANWDQGCVPNCTHVVAVTNGTPVIGNYDALAKHLTLSGASNLRFAHAGARLVICDTLVLQGTLETATGGTRQVELRAQSGVGLLSVTDPAANPFDLLLINTDAADGYVHFDTDVQVSAAGTLTFTQGSIFTGNEVRILNPAPAAITGANAQQHVFYESGSTPATIVRAMGQLGSYVYPTGVRRPGDLRYYMPQTHTYANAGALFTHTALRVAYVDGDPSAGGLPLGPDCTPLATYQEMLNSGLWTTVPEGAGVAGTYNLVQEHAWGSYTNLTDGGQWTIVTRDAAPWALQGTCGPSNFPSTGDPLLSYRDGMTSFSEKATAFVPVLLPVEALWLNATPEQAHIRLNWTSRAETDNAGYWLQRSTTGASFEDLTWVDGLGTPATASAYQWDDRQVLPGVRYYYRLRQVDFNGNTTLSNVAEAMLPQSAHLQARLFPNPAQGEVSVAYRLPLEETATLRFFNTLGQEVRTEQLRPDTRAGLWRLNLDGLAAGTYTLVLQQGTEVVSLRLVKEARR